MLTDKLFTGQRKMADLDIYHYGARFYNPKLGRFLSPDTIVPEYINPQGWNRYSYALNNPLRYTDPTGHWVNETNDPIKEQRENARRNNGERERNRRDRNRINGGGNNNSQTPTPSQLAALDVTLPTPTLPSSTGTPPTSFTQNPSEQTCVDCGIEAIEGIFHVAEGLAFTAASLYALGAVLAVVPEGLIAAPIFLTTALVGINFAMFGAQEIQYAVTNGTSAEPDPIPLVHLVFPDFMK